MNSYQVGVSAEAYAAAIFARSGYDVLVQYGANQPKYDLVIAEDNKSIKVSVKGSQDGSWGLTQSYLKNANYHKAVDKWLSKHDTAILFCFVQFKDTNLLEHPRIYLAWTQDVAKRLKETAKGRGDTILYEHKIWTPRAYAAGTIDKIPDKWHFSKERLYEIFGAA